MVSPAMAVPGASSAAGTRAPASAASMAEGPSGASKAVAGPASSAVAKPQNWLSVPERGTLWGITALLWIATAFGRAPVRFVVRFVALYYAVFDRKLVKASRQWLTAVHGRPATWRMVYGHIRRFANVTLDRAFLIKGYSKPYRFTRDGDYHLYELTQKKRGAILLGAHIGSFEAMRLAGDEEQHKINIVGNFSNAKMINALLDRLSPNNTARLISIDPGDVSFVFAIQERIDAGELVAILGDRLGPNQPFVEVEFFGRPARFPVGPIQLASLLKCPIYLTFGLFREPDLYQLSCEPFADPVELPRKNRREALREYVQRYAKKVEEKARSAPDNWFNFYDFWGTE